MMLTTGAVLAAYGVWAWWAAHGRTTKVAYHPILSPVLRQLVPPRMQAVTLWTWVILLRPGTVLSPSGKLHELVHVSQFKRWPFTFPVRYLWAHLRDGGYAGNRFERAAKLGKWA